MTTANPSAQKVGRRVAARRRYYLFKILDKHAAAYDGARLGAESFGVSPAQFAAWVEGSEPIPAWVVELAVKAYRVPPPAALVSRRGILLAAALVVALGVTLFLLLPLLLR